MRTKICGITNKEDLVKAVYYGAWAVGFVFYKKSPRYVSPSRVRRLVEDLPPFVTPVGVFLDSGERAIRDVCHFARIRTIQLHGDEEPNFCKRFKDFKIIKAFRVTDDFDVSQVMKYKVDAWLFDAYQENVYGGTGKTFNWHLLKGKKFERPVILSGGLSAENIQEAIAATQEIQPFAVDVSSGVERSPGLKDPQKIRAFFEALTLPETQSHVKL
jgi:phosphoribosylanthranilate isomerase